MSSAGQRRPPSEFQPKTFKLSFKALRSLPVFHSLSKIGILAALTYSDPSSTACAILLALQWARSDPAAVTRCSFSLRTSVEASASDSRLQSQTRRHLEQETLTSPRCADRSLVHFSCSLFPEGLKDFEEWLYVSMLLTRRKSLMLRTQTICRALPRKSASSSL
jgi:hypothetical protein